MKKYLKLTTLMMIFVALFSACEKEDDENNAFAEEEPNGTFATANELTLTDIYDAKINPAQDKDYFVISASKDLKLIIDGDSNLELYFYVYDENQVQIYGGDTGSRGASFTQDIASTEYNGKVYVMIESAYPDDTGNYTIKIE